MTSRPEPSGPRDQVRPLRVPKCAVPHTSESAALVIRPAGEDDLGSILELEREGFPAREQWSAASWSGELHADNRAVLVATPPGLATHAGSVAQSSPAAHPGPAAMPLAADDEPGSADSREHLIGVITVQHIGEVAELNRIVVAESFRGHGVADRLMYAGIAAVAADCLEMLLEVRDDNVPALGLYARHGFGEIARRRDYYGAGADALVLRRELRLEDADRVPEASTAPDPAPTPAEAVQETRPTPENRPAKENR